MRRGAALRYDMPDEQPPQPRRRKKAESVEERPAPLDGEQPIPLPVLCMRFNKSYRAMMRYIGPARMTEPELYAEKFGQTWVTYPSWVRLWQRKLEAIPTKNPQKRGKR